MKFLEILGVAVLATLQTLPYSLIAPIVPLEFIHRGISQITIGILFCAYGFAQIVTPYFAHKLASARSLYWVANLGVTFLTVSIWMFALSSLFKPAPPFLAFSIIFRFSQGVGAAM